MVVSLVMAYQSSLCLYSSSYSHQAGKSSRADRNRTPERIATRPRCQPGISCGNGVSRGPVAADLDGRAPAAVSIELGRTPPERSRQRAVLGISSRDSPGLIAAGLARLWQAGDPPAPPAEPAWTAHGSPRIRGRDEQLNALAPLSESNRYRMAGHGIRLDSCQQTRRGEACHYQDHAGGTVTTSGAGQAPAP